MPYHECAISFRLTSTPLTDILPDMATQAPNDSSPVVNIRIRFCALLLLGVLTYGITGYRLIEGWPWLDSLT